MLIPLLRKNDKRASWLILLFSAIVFAAVMLLSKVKLEVDLGFNVHFFALINSVINSWVALLLVVALVAVRRKRYELHRKLMLIAMILSILFLISYISHHLFAGDTRFGDIDHNGILTPEEKIAAGPLRIIYYIILGTHIPLAGLILPLILFTAYRALIGEYPRHKRLARITWPIWFYVAVTGVVVYLMIRPYYS